MAKQGPQGPPGTVSNGQEQVLLMLFLWSGDIILLNSTDLRSKMSKTTPKLVQ